ncbi:DNA (cytosine-5-)-methyltransferase [Nitrosopumilus piranensis]|uniref:Modification methylase DsaV n=1 Tax=Nitrosopumilus piranensis TaxID=1582439 RepID=A0A0C5CCZ4_9ARCH|nr:DNA (cytosine-5-)-methyltransferase [Nitrosopumilus piranensis]AJM93042.1 Modification methylase DsaV [Nitrosopumilus piranensis]
MSPPVRFDFSKPGKTKFTFSDICAGIGGMRMAFENLGGKCVFTSEWDRFCQETYRENFGETPHGDITKIPIRDIPRHDVMLAGFPCQPFSKSGFATRKFLNKKDGFADDTQGKIFFRIAKIIAAKKPKAIFLENVPRLVKMNKGKTFEIIINEIEKLGYNCKWKVISAETVVPQRRERLYIVATRKGIEFEFPEIPDLKPQLKQILERRVDKKYVLSDNTWQWLQDHAKKHSSMGNGFGFRMADPKKTACTLSARYGKDGSEILIPRRNGNPRKLSPRECARLMGFPDNFAIPVSDTQAYKQFGNSVAVPVIYLIGYSFIKKITNMPFPKIFQST